MKAKIITIIWGLSFFASAVTMPFMNWAFGISFSIFCLMSWYIEHNRKRLLSDLDEMFGRDSDLE